MRARRALEGGSTITMPPLCMCLVTRSLWDRPKEAEAQNGRPMQMQNASIPVPGWALLWRSEQVLWRSEQVLTSACGWLWQLSWLLHGPRVTHLHDAHIAWGVAPTHKAPNAQSALERHP